MSLRREIHSAFDVIAPPLGGMPERMVQTVLAEQKARGRKTKMLIRMRAPLSLVAVLLLVAFVAAVLIGSRVIQDWNAFHKPVPAGGSHATLATLEDRPLQLPQVPPSAQCPAGPEKSVGVYGLGPFYGDSQTAQGPLRSRWGIYWDLFAETDRNVTGLMLVRAIDVKTQQPYVFSGPYAAGPADGTDKLGGETIEHHSELVLDTSHQPTETLNGKTVWPFRLGVPSGNSGCYGWQIDGDNFTETFVFDAGITQ